MFDPVLLRSFLAVAETGGFTAAARRLGLQQSTVSQHVQRLERAADRQLFLRDTHSVELTGEGETMLGFARSILDAHERAAAYFAGPRVSGRLRFGVSEDFAVTELPQVLRTFRHSHPQVDLQLTVGLTGVLHEQLAEGTLDLVLGKRVAGASGGGRTLWSNRTVWRDRLVWAAGEDFRLDPDRNPDADGNAGNPDEDRELPLPLIVYPPPSVTRARALAALDRAARPWRITCTASGLSGMIAAARAGIGVVAHSLSLIPPGLRPLPADAGLPDLGSTDFVLTGGRGADSEPARALIDAVLANGARLSRRALA
jgi:DNA-binding transcriptional LysR family regulator